MDATELQKLGAEVDDFLGEFDACFRTYRSREHLRVYVRGQLGSLDRKSIEPMALEAGVPPRTLQEFLSIHRWDYEAMGRRLREIVARDHADPQAVGVFDETSFAKKGTETVGVQRQYCWETGKTDNCVVTVHLGYVGREVRSLLDSDLYLPEESWANRPDRRAKVGVPEDLQFRTKWRIALDMLERTLAEGLDLPWITADEGYGSVPAFLDGVEALGCLYVVEVPRSVSGWTPGRHKRGKPHRRVDALWERGGPSWETYRVKDTSKGPLVWEVRESPFVPSWCEKTGKRLRLLVARQVLSGEIKYFLSNAPATVDVKEILRVAFTRWGIERLFEDAKQEVGMRHFEVRKYLAVQRHLTVSMVSLLLLERLKAKLGEKNRRPHASAHASHRRDLARHDALPSREAASP